MNSSKEYVYAISRMGLDEVQLSFYKYLLTHGKEFNYTDVDWEKSSKLCKERECQIKQCFYNAQMIGITQDDKYQYYEGFATNIIPTEHAWLLDKTTKKILDVTWCHFDDDRPTDYFGIPIPHEFIARYQVKYKVADNLLFRYIDTKLPKNKKI